MAYHIYLDLHEFISAIRPWRVTTMCVEALPQRRYNAGELEITTSFLLTTPYYETVYAARLTITLAAFFDHEQQLITQTMQRLTRDARLLLNDYLTRQSLVVEPGMHLVPGLLDDVLKLQTQQQIWRIQRDDARNCASYRIVPLERNGQ